jgi:F0F1-type ATP synthase membrane subunit c/vacuolar-type H+-ATPase subunit K
VSVIFSVIFCEAVAIYGVVVAILLATKTETVAALDNGDFPAAAKTAGYAIFAAGGTVGFANLVCGCVTVSRISHTPRACAACVTIPIFFGPRLLCDISGPGGVCYR